jgi:CheY-like chemotaxis protein
MKNCRFFAIVRALNLHRTPGMCAVSSTIAGGPDRIKALALGVIQTKKQILVADDSPTDVFMLEHGLAESGLKCAILHVEDGEQALEALQRPRTSDQEFCLIVLDWYLPKRSGEEVLRVVQGNKDSPLCVVLTSGLPHQEMQRLNMQGISVWNKPGDLDGYLELGESLKQLILAATSC